MKDNYIVKGNVFTGKVVRQKSLKTAIVERELVKYVPKYERYAKKTARIAIHIPESMSVSVGDVVKFGETRKISKTKSFILMDILENAK